MAPTDRLKHPQEGRIVVNLRPKVELGAAAGNGMVTLIARDGDDGVVI
jgi:hypothetical protein